MCVCVCGGGGGGGQSDPTFLIPDYNILLYTQFPFLVKQSTLHVQISWTNTIAIVPKACETNYLLNDGPTTSTTGHHTVHQQVSKQLV